MSAVAAPSDRRFRRAAVRPAKPRIWRGFLERVATCAVLAPLVAYAGYRGAVLVAHAPVLKIDRIVLHGNERLSTGELQAVLNGLRGENLVWTDLDVWRRRLLASPWVREAALRRSLPSTVDVTISERQPLGIGRLKSEMYLVDDSGVVIDQYGPQYADLDLPIIDGLLVRPGRDGSETDQARAELAARLVAALKAKPDLAQKLSQVDVRDVHNASVILSGDRAVLRVGDDRFLPRLQSYTEVAAALRERVPAIDYVDLRFDDRIYVRPAGRPARTRDIAPGTNAATKRRRR